MPINVENDKLDNIMNLIEKLEEDDDVLEVYTNIN